MVFSADMIQKRWQNCLFPCITKKINTKGMHVYHSLDCDDKRYELIFFMMNNGRKKCQSVCWFCYCLDSDRRIHHLTGECGECDDDDDNDDDGDENNNGNCKHNR